MRIRRLDLLRYGHFTDSSLDFGGQAPDLHIVFGPNEAGKTTALSAIEDLFFGIPHNSPFNFIHDYSSLRIGMVLEADGKTLEVRRRKGNRDTLLTPDDVPVAGGEGALGAFLASADRAFFTRMFSLDHRRLREGGREILEARDEVGQMLFSAGAGIADLRHRLKALNDEADALWAPRRATRREYYQVDDRLKAADRALREHTITASAWQDLKRARDSAEDAYDALEKEIEQRSVELRKVSRVRRVFRLVRRTAELEAELVALGEVALLPEDAGETLRAADVKDTNATGRIETLTEQLEAALQDRVGLTSDEALLPRAEEIQQLHEWRIRVSAGKADLQKRRVELTNAQTELRRLAKELGWQTEDDGLLIGRIPPRPKIAIVRTLLNRRGELFSAADNAQAALDDADVLIDDLQLRLERLPEPQDASTLGALIKATRQRGDIASEIRIADAEAQDARAAIVSGIKTLRPEVGDEGALAALPTPTPADVQSHRDDRRDLEARLHSCQGQMRVANNEVVLAQKAQERITTDEHAVSSEELSRSRAQRDALWSAIKSRRLDGGAVSDEDEADGVAGVSDDDLPSVYEAAIQGADDAADIRFERAEAVARLAEVSRQIVEKRDMVDSLLQQEEQLNREGEALDAAWHEMWKGVPFLPLSPEAMLEWMTVRSAVVDLMAREAEAERRAAALGREQSEANRSLLAEMEKIGIDTASLADQQLQVVIEAAADAHSSCGKNADARRQLQEALVKATADSSRAHKTLEKALDKRSRWESDWKAALVELGLEEAGHDAVAAQVDVIDEMREVAVQVNDLQHERIDKIEGDIADFDSAVMEFVGTVTPDLAGLRADEAVLELESRLDQTRRTIELQKEKDSAIASFKQAIAEWEEARREAGEIIGTLQQDAGVKGMDQLKTAIERSSRLRELRTELAELERTLDQEGDGLSQIELRGECDCVNVDELATRETMLDQDIEDLRERLMQARELRLQARRELDGVRGDDAAARDAADRQAALAEMEEVAGRYVRARSAALLLEWAIDRYRRAKQAPLLKRAGELFGTLTDGSFVDLQLDFDEQDHVHLAGVREDGSRVGTIGMSAGTADQLYLALRVASVEDYLERAAPLPFIADDLFINFDNGRAAAGFEVLGQLAQKTQVLFFTHHRHLIDVAKAALGDSVPVTSLVQH
ncbi:MAG: AAA family ATPase [Coriobacteriia bacterium]|nr:AAA family ATPase [Coriobacteriia bacterium]